MSEWSWVAVGFTVTYGSLIAYFLLMRRRRIAVRRHIGRLR